MVVADAIEKFSFSVREVFSLTYGQLSLLLEGAYMKNFGDDDIDDDVLNGEKMSADEIRDFFGG